METGRDEHRQKLEQRLSRKLQGYPKSINEYYISEYNTEYTTLADYVYKLCAFCDFLGRDPIDAEVSEIYAYLRKLKDMSVQYQGGVHSALLNYYNFLFRSQRIPKNIMLNIERPNQRKSNSKYHKRTDKLVSRDEIKILLEHTEYEALHENKHQSTLAWRDLAIITLLSTTGSRVTPITEIDIGDVDSEKNCVTVMEKGHSELTLYLCDICVERIKQWLAVRNTFDKTGSNALFLTSRGLRMDSGAVRRMLKSRAEKHGIDPSHVSPHAFRAAFGVYIQETHNDIYYTQQCMGHKSITMTTHYVRSLKEDIRREGSTAAAELVR